MGAAAIKPAVEIGSQVLNIIPSIIQSIVGGSQLRKADRIESENPRPDASIAPSIDKLVKYAYGLTQSNDIPGGGLYRDEIRGATSSGINAASQLGSGAEAYGMLGQLIGREQNAYADLARTTAEQVAGYRKDYMNVLPMKADEENRVWNWNEAQPYLAAMETARQLRDAGTKNMFSGAKNVFGSTAEAINPEFNSSLLWGDTLGGRKSNVTMEMVLKAIKELGGSSGSNSGSNLGGGTGIGNLVESTANNLG